MANIAFVTDSTAYLTQEQIEKYNITVVPLSVIFEGEAFREGVDMTTTEFYRKMSESKTLPSTSQPPVGEFAAVFENLLKDHGTVMCFLLSGNLSGTLRSAETAATMVEGNVIVVDSEIASYGIAGPLMDGCEMAARGASPEEIADMWKRAAKSMQSRFVLDTLENLHKGGRIGGAAAVFGALLQIKPILTVREGRIELYEKVRTHKRAMEKMLSDFDADASKGSPIRLGVIHAQREADAIALREQLVQKYPNVYAEVAELGPVVGAHTGPGLLALVYYPWEVQAK